MLNQRRANDYHVDVGGCAGDDGRASVFGCARLWRRHDCMLLGIERPATQGRGGEKAAKASGGAGEEGSMLMHGTCSELI